MPRHMHSFQALVLHLALCVCIAPALAAEPTATGKWRTPLVKQGKLQSPLVEVSPFVFKHKLYLLENWQKQWEHPGVPDGSMFQQDETRIRDVASDTIVSIPLKGHGLGMAMVWEDRVYVFAGNWGKGEKKWDIRTIEMTSSADLKNWTEPVTVLTAEPQERFFNVSVCRGKEKFVLLVETNDPKWPPFTFKYFTSDDLKSWTAVPNGVYGVDKYVGGPALYYAGDWYYTLYLQALPNNRFETRITRSQDLVHWEDAPEGRPFVTFDETQRVYPLRPDSVRETNASDAEVVYWQDRTLVYFTGGDQQLCGDLQWATFEGTPQELFESYFAPEVAAGTDVVPPEHDGDWTPVLITPRSVNAADGAAQPGDDTARPSPQQQLYQGNQLGAFVHFGPASYNGSDMLAVPDAALFNPQDLDAEQWVLAARSFGARHIVLTAKHHNGYCLWPTKTTKYSVASSPWKDGKGDVVKELADACRKHGMQLGLYISGGDKHYDCWSTPDPLGERKLHGDRNKYFRYFMQQLEELLTNYGELSVVWMDGAFDPFGWDVMDPETLKPLGTAHGDAIAAMIRALQPNAVIFGGTRPDVRWSGNEAGWAPYPVWNIVPRGNGLANWLSPKDAGWFIVEANLHTRSTWFWTPNSDQTLRSVDALMEAYQNSIGRGANLLVNMTPDTTGRIPQAEVDRLKQFGEALERRFGKPLGHTRHPAGEAPSATLELVLPEPATVGYTSLTEELAPGQHVLRYAVDGWDGQQWKTLAEGQSIGRRRIDSFEPVKVSKLRLRILEATAPATITDFSAY